MEETQISFYVPDINECDESTSGCDQICNNTQGNFTCSCFSGYTYNSTSKQCKQGMTRKLLTRV
ncbi:hypothetical protein DPMN_076421 [Dreissena polymorpha]|uniref:EGF-like domain-containing protein n=1 Tax=Dreissena polymorpha TaxID=45954 RepID=A0A9D4BNC8_DREPO|nr:hypothetical protein DPMN_076421 [Dreissena polymorpha]